MLFYLGTHLSGWMADLDVPLFISARRLRLRPPRWRARCQWALDSGGFSELSMYGEWRTSAEQYAREASFWQRHCGKMDWAAIQDWMVEPFILAKTGLTVREHQLATVRSWLDLRSMAPDVRWAPVLQGWEHDDYLRHVDDYASAGTDLTSLPVVGVGSVCRRQHTGMAERLIRDLSNRGIKCHAFGFKTVGLMNVGDVLTSADSMAWSFNARHDMPLVGCRHQNCANCVLYALEWRRRLLCNLGDAYQSTTTAKSAMR